MNAAILSDVCAHTRGAVGGVPSQRAEGMGDAHTPRAIVQEPLQTDIEPVARTLWDVLIIGVGPAGSVAACVLAQLGRRVLLVDRSHMPREKVCGCCLADVGAEALRTLGLSDVLDGAALVKSCSLRAGRSSASLHIAPYHVIDRATLDHRLAMRARAAGAELLTGWSAQVRTGGDVELHPAPGSPHARCLPERTPPSVLARARVVIVADGLGGSSLNERAEFAWSITPASRMGVGATLGHSPVPLPVGTMAMLSHRSGYIGLVRLPSGAFDLAAALDPVAVRVAGGPAALCAQIIQSCSGDPQALLGARWRGTPLLTRTRPCVESGNVMVVGDAAGYVEPFTGEGMTWAIQGAIAAARIANARLTGVANPGVWASSHALAARRRTRRCTLVARLVRHDRVLRVAIGGVRFWPLLGDAVVRLLSPPSAPAQRVMA